MRKSPFYEKALAGEEFGLYNGYVAFSDELPQSWQSSWNEEGDVLDNHVRPHGGITYDSIIKPGFEIIPLTAIPDPNEWSNGIRCIGFDTAHLGDNAKIWSFDNCKIETLEMLEEVERLIEKSHG